MRHGDHGDIRYDLLDYYWSYYIKKCGMMCPCFLFGDDVDIAKDFDDYMAHLTQGLGHSDRHAGLTGYCAGLMLPLARKSIESIAARVDPLHASTKHQSLHHFVAKTHWSDHELLRRVMQGVAAPDIGDRT